jgi:hypothetical protein
VGVPINVVASSSWLRLLSLVLVIFGIAAAFVGPINVLLELLNEVVGAFIGQRTSDRPEALFDRLNRGAAEYRDLVDAISKLVIPIVVGLLALAGVVVAAVVALD